MKIIIIIPTYNECKNIISMISALQEQFHNIHYDMHILVVDDNSPDGTGDLVKQEQKKFNNVHLITGEKAGLGAAYIRGMNHAIGKLNADVVFEMDADFSHKPEDVPRMITALDEGADFVIGSRYVTGGSIPKNWSYLRRMNSLYGNIFARFVAGMHSIRDCTAGFRAIRATLLTTIDLSHLKVQGYAFQIALLYHAIIKGAVIKEIPVDFIDRTEGQSKLGISDIIEFIINVWWIRFQYSKVFIKFCLVGASGVIVNIGFFSLFLDFGMNKFLVSPITTELSIIWNFLLNNYWTFRWRETTDMIGIKGLKFNLISFLSLGISYLVFVILSYRFPNVPPQVHQLIGIVPATLVNYFMNSYWTFRENKGLIA